MAKEFKGKIELDVRDSTPGLGTVPAGEGARGGAERPDRPLRRHRSRGVVAFRRRIEMPTLQRLADDGLTYTQWHTTALCSPTRSCFLTGRNHHQNGMACITEGSIGYPGGNARIPPECGPLAEVMRQNGWSTFWLGKNHNVPVDDLHAGATKESWPLHQGFDRFYGFLGGETNQWYPDARPRTTITSTSRTRPRTATTCRRTSPTTRSR